MLLKVSYLLFLNIVTSHIVTYYVLLDALLSATYSVLVSGARVFAAVFSESLLTKVLLLKTGKLTVATDLAQCFIKLRYLPMFGCTIGHLLIFWLISFHG